MWCRMSDLIQRYWLKTKNQKKRLQYSNAGTNSLVFLLCTITSIDAKNFTTCVCTTGLQDAKERNCLINGNRIAGERVEKMALLKVIQTLMNPSRCLDFVSTKQLCVYSPSSRSILLRGVTVRDVAQSQKRRFRISLAPRSLDVIKEIASFIVA